jgi:YD repeat-containing protein
MQALWEIFRSLTLDNWSDIATIASGGGTIIAALIALSAVKQARQLQDEKSQPYVIAQVENNPNVQEMLELSIKNVGDTAARDIEVVFSPHPQRSAWGSNDEPTYLMYPQTIPVLVPGQEWRTTWDSAHFRQETDLPDRHTVTLKYVGLKDSKHTEVYVLDWKYLYMRGYLEEKTIHHVAKDFREVTQLLKRGLPVRSPQGAVKVRLEEPPANEHV